MKELLIEAFSKQLSETIASSGGAKAVFGDVIHLDGKEIVPVAQISIHLSASAIGSGAGESGLSAFGSMNSGGGQGAAGAGIDIEITPLGYIKSGDVEPEFVRLDLINPYAPLPSEYGEGK